MSKDRGSKPEKRAWMPPANPCGHVKSLHDGNDWHCIREQHDASNGGAHHYYVRMK